MALDQAALEQEVATLRRRVEALEAIVAKCGCDIQPCAGCGELLSNDDVHTTCRTCDRRFCVFSGSTHGSDGWGCGHCGYNGGECWDCMGGERKCKCNR